MTARASLRFFPESTNRLPPTHRTSLFLYYFALLLYSFISYTPTQLNTTPHESSKLSPSMSVGAGRARGCRLQESASQRADRTQFSLTHTLLHWKSTLQSFTSLISRFFFFRFREMRNARRGSASANRHGQLAMTSVGAAMAAV